MLDDVYDYVNQIEYKKNKISSAIRKIYLEIDGDVSVLRRFTAFKEAFIKQTSKDFINDEIIEDIYIRFSNIFKLDSFLIPVIEYKGDIDNVAEIFEKMNTGSVTLSKYEVFAASWSKYETEVP